MNVCEKSNMKHNAHVFLPVSAKGTSEVNQTAQFILRGLILYAVTTGQKKWGERQVSPVSVTSWFL